MTFLIDTGASVSLIPKTDIPSPDFGKMRPYFGSVVSVCGGLLRIVGQCSVELCSHDATFVRDFLVCDGVSHAIIGMDFLSQHSATVDIPSQALRVANHVLPFGSLNGAGVRSTRSVTKKEELDDVLAEFPSVLRSEENCIGETTVIEHDIELFDANCVPVHCRPRPIPYHLRDVVTEQLNKMLRLGVIRESRSPWSSPILLVPKSDGQYRFCIDFRRLNALTKKDATPMPSVEDTFSLIGNAKIFSTLDLLSGFWQVNLSPRARELTAFTVGNRHFEFSKMAFGLTGAPGTFVRLMSRVLQGLDNVIVFGDDVLIYSLNFDDHAKHLRAVLNRLREAGLVVNMKKCQFGKEEVKFLGHLISSGCTAPLPDKVKSIEEFPPPKTKKQLQTFLGLAGFYRRFIPEFSTVAAPLYDLLQAKAYWKWEDPEDKAFNLLKDSLRKEPIVLALPDSETEFELYTDASDVGLGAVLSQRGRVVEYASRRLNQAERNYSVTERELLAIVWAIEKWRKYLFGKRFLLNTDHRPLTFLHTVKEPRGRIARWISRIQEYDFRIRYTRGKDNTVADCLSRSYSWTRPLDHETLPQGMNPVSALTFYEDLQSLSERQLEDDELCSIMEALRDRRKLEPRGGCQRRLCQLGKQLSLSAEGVLMRTFKLRGNLVRVPLIPASERQELLERFHSSAHLGVNKTYDLLRINAYWPGMEADVQKFVSSYGRCQLAKPARNLNRAPLKPIFTSSPMEMWAMDIMGPLAYTSSGKRYILVATDLFSRWVETMPLADQSAKSVAKAFLECVILRHGVPQTLLTDQGTNFESHLMKEICDLLNIRKVRTSTFHPRTDGQAERMNRTIKERIAAVGGCWEEALPFVTFSINSTVNSMTGFSPYQLVYGRHPPQFFQTPTEFSPRRSMHDFVNQLVETMERLRATARLHSDQCKKNAANAYRSSLSQMNHWKPFPVGSLVRYRNRYPDRNNRKFSDRYVGPFTVLARRGVNYKVDFNSGKCRWVHHDDLLPWRNYESVTVSDDKSDNKFEGHQGSGPEDRCEKGSDANDFSTEEDSDGSGQEETEDSGGEESSDESSGSSSVDSVPGPRRSGRDRMPPRWLKDFYVH